MEDLVPGLLVCPAGGDRSPPFCPSNASSVDRALPDTCVLHYGALEMKAPSPVRSPAAAPSLITA